MSILLSEGKTLISLWKGYSGSHDWASLMTINPQTHWTLSVDPALCQVLSYATSHSILVISLWQMPRGQQGLFGRWQHEGRFTQPQKVKGRIHPRWIDPGQGTLGTGPHRAYFFLELALQPFPNSGRCRENPGRHLRLWVWEKTLSETAPWQDSTAGVLAWVEGDQ